MRTSIKITGILLVLVMAGNGYLQAQRGMGGMRGMRDTARVTRPGLRNDIRQQAFHYRFDRRPMYGWGRGFGPMGWQGPGNYVRPGMRGFGPGSFGGMHGFGPAFRPQIPGGSMRNMDNIPNLTDKQKKDITDLRQKQQEEMSRLREEMNAKVQSLRDEHRKKVLDLLTDDQKKFVESRQGPGNNTTGK